MELVLVLSVDRYEFTDERTGEIRKGVTLQYVNDYREDRPTSLGFKPIKASANDEVFDTIKKSGAPGLYKLHSRTRPGKEGKPTLTIVKAEHVKNMKIFEGS
jgi:hypothetical protein